MAQEMKKVNGRWVVTGNPQSSDLVPFVKPKAQAPKPAAKPAAKPKQRPWWDKLRNDALYEVKQLLAPPLQRNPLNETRRALTSPLARAVPQQLGLAAVGAVDNTNRMAYSLYQRHVQKKPKADPSAGRTGELLDSYADTAYRLLGATPPSQMAPAEREFDETRRSLALNAGLAGIPGAGLGAAAATTGLGTAVRGGAAFAVNELLSNYLDNNTGGNVVNLINALKFDPTDFKGVPFVRGLRKGEEGPELPGAVDIGNDDMVDAANKSLVPNALAGLGLGAAVGAGAAGFRNIQRRVRAGRDIEVVQRARAVQEDAGLIEKAEDGSYRFTEQARQPAEQITPVKVEDVTPAQAAPAAAPMDDFKAANAAMEEQLGIKAPEAAPATDDAAESFGKAQPGEPPQDDLAANPWDVEYDPSLPESDALGRVVDELDDEELMVVAQGQGPVVEQVNQLVETRARLEVNPDARLDMTAAPTASLAQPVVPFADQWQSLPTDQLKSLASPDNSPELFQRIQGMTGKDWEEFGKTDVLDGLSSFESDGITVLPNRLMQGQRVMRTAEIFTDPVNLQYKGDVDAGGVQRQGSLDGVESWSTDAEGVIQVWTNPTDGNTYAVNGHNRLAAAKRLGVPSLRVEELLAATAEQARAQGAIANIAGGGGTVFDAAKFLRDSGVTDPAQLKQMGIPLDSGLGTQGLALSRLPGNLFQDAVDGRLSLGKALALGGSGLDDVQMQAAMKAMAGSDITDAAFNEVLQQARSAPVVQGEQVDLFGNTEAVSLMRQKAELAAKIRADLIGDKNLFGRVGRNANKLKEAGNQISVQGSTQVAMDAQSVLANFDATKYAEGTPISQLLNDGAAQVASGAKPAAIAKRIKAQLVKAAEETPPIEVQSDLLSAAAKAEEATAAIEPQAMGAADRQALKTQVLQKAIASGEVRPPSTPIPVLPEPAKVRLDELQSELATTASGPPLSPGSVLYHGTTEGGREGIMANGFRVSEAEKAGTVLGEGVYFASRESYAAAYGGKTAWGQLPDDAKILDLRAQNKTVGELADEIGVTGPRETYQGDVRLSYKQQQQVKDWALANGYDGIRYRSFDTPDKPELETVVYSVDLANRIVGSKAAPAPAIRPGSKAAQAMADEVRLAVEYGKADALNKFDQEEGLRDAFDYEVRSFDEKKDLGAVEGWDDVMPTEVMGAKPPGIADRFAEQMRAMAESDARMFRTIGEGIGELRKGIDELGGVNPRPAGTSLGPGVKLYHGTSEVGAKSIQEQGFALGRDPESTLGDGVYFFTNQDLPSRYGPALVSGTLPADIKILDLFSKNVKVADLLDKLGFAKTKAQKDAIWANQLTKQQKAAVRKHVTDQGFDGVRYEPGFIDEIGKAGDRSEVLIFDPKVANRVTKPFLSLPPVRPEPLQLAQAIEQPGFSLPQALSRSAPRYGSATIRFGSDLDRAAYVLANDAVKPSKAAPKFREAVEAAGLNVAEVVAHGRRVKAAIKRAAGGGAAPQKAMELDIPAQPFGDVAKPPTKAGDIPVRQQIEANDQTMDDIRRKAQQEGC